MQEKHTKKWCEFALSAGLMALGCVSISSQTIQADSTTPAADVIDYSKITPVAQPAGQEVVIPTGTVLTRNNSDYAKLSIANWKDMPEGTTYTWNGKPLTIINGLAKGNVGVTLPDGTLKSVYVTVKIAGRQQIKLTHKTHLFNENGQQLNSLILKTGSIVNVNDTTEINGHQFYTLDNQYYLPVTNFKVPKKMQVKAAKGSKRVMHSTYLYDVKGRQANGLILAVGSRVTIQKIPQDNNINNAAGRMFYAIGNDLYAPVRNITGLETEWQNKALTLYNNKGKKIGKLPAHTPYKTYGDPIRIKGKPYDIIGKNKLISASIG
ncbi:SLAP domain-containing protein [Lactobacillus sp. ESL0791]|uniref:SLAP domain-containing protein n=1 Tax=Lactobacillus sp. ESL0791 TaxID=2983234 RepID=UPI0023F75D85|nr:SLAP domain-containing protein [Lactobacillus sp. ESL0791]MDF7639638.1 SLAP domain-containing protein [Lactobacillus sp. ESL0791]